MNASRALTQAILAHDDDALDAALRAGPALDATDIPPGITPLMLAARAGNEAAISRLLAAGASLSVQGPAGLTALHIAAMEGQAGAVRALLEAGADPGPGPSLGSAAHFAAAAGHLPVLEQLVAAGADVLETDKDGRTAEDYARAGGKPAIAAFLARQRKLVLFDKIRDLRSSVAEIVKTMGEAEQSRGERDAAERAEEESAPELAELPATAYDPGGVPPELMRELSAALPPLSREEWEQILGDHLRFLQSGGAAWWGRWESLQQSNVAFGLYDGPAAASGAQADLHLRRLEGLDARGAKLTIAHLVGVIAPGVDFSRADLSRAFATDSDFTGARFDHANLSRADFSRSSFRNASLRDADLSFTDLECCDLTGADLTGARLQGTKLPRARLDDVKR